MRKVKVTAEFYIEDVEDFIRDWEFVENPENMTDEEINQAFKDSFDFYHLSFSDWTNYINAKVEED